MTKRSLSLMAAMGLLASLASGTPSQASMVNVTLNFSDYNNGPNFSDTISKVVFQFSGLDGISSLSFSGTAYASGPLAEATVNATATGAETVTVNFGNPTSVFNVTGWLNFETTGTTSSPISLTSMTVTASADQQSHGQVLLTPVLHYLAVPEPASMGLLGIGISGFFAFRRFFEKRTTRI